MIAEETATLSPKFETAGPGRGGKRKGAGRPRVTPQNKRVCSFWLSEPERQTLKRVLAYLREGYKLYPEKQKGVVMLLKTSE